MHDGNVTILALDDHRLALGVVEDGAKAILGFGRGDFLHAAILAN